MNGRVVRELSALNTERKEMPQAEPELKGQENTDDLAGGGVRDEKLARSNFPLGSCGGDAAGSAGGRAAARETTDNSTKRQRDKRETASAVDEQKEAWQSAKVAMSKLKLKSKSKKAREKSKSEEMLT
ncbi:hypothetical protein TRV_04833 [Trichophyton verrucosum HKI 0517]|uniref:Uncharacterized protein n=1 Tax=Trichophyton verrucosum (strain HKI 0517) TaxID=663202 RepID=D4DCH8_TRIVH|nr:uncharacterized protein TRV_04833 [Trichophyton verrucosum HKI 0517]EFE40439.1 hypothetical protein TRV_04833 [Trichophyton verrucosum HKI 0517]